jgi:hypothetical protein
MYFELDGAAIMIKRFLKLKLTSFISSFQLMTKTKTKCTLNLPRFDNQIDCSSLSEFSPDK